MTVRLGESVAAIDRRLGHARLRRGDPGPHDGVGCRADHQPAGRRAVRRPAARSGARRPDAQPARTTPRCSSSATWPGSPTHRTGDVLPQLGSVALQAGEHVGKTIDRMTAQAQGSRALPLPRQGHDGHHRTRRRRGGGAARTSTSPASPAFLAWGAVHLALLSGGDAKSAALTNWFWTCAAPRPALAGAHPSRRRGLTTEGRPVAGLIEDYAIIGDTRTVALV